MYIKPVKSIHHLHTLSLTIRYMLIQYIFTLWSSEI
jgi:hypothetical protein